ncbi:carboxymuconolactone decarboxylase family protein [Natronospira bacteriovora]|uniref:Alkyl hydroperoxide reductase AhpD n=1 Tax=Natronospira bacteriovora TaxID=3069753 RepID=A0ABU0W4B6_9GAMM|nr:carboxymuconolactone decarboxylase family protein [Natronospira sp. AB-CW4]MDQ2068861.1 carboxymuconolactone decarboxylase family protein [Natronospira sp. AB-CW4]
MSVSDLKQALPDYAKDIRLNLSSVLKKEGAPGLSQEQVYGVAVASAYASDNVDFARQVEAMVQDEVEEATINAAKAAASIMAMNNVYYRFLHLVGDEEYGRMPANLRMNVIGRPGVEKTDFELYSLAVSAINGCGLCVENHEKALRRADVSREAIQSAVRIAAVVKAAATTTRYAA